MALQPPRSVSFTARSCQLAGAQKSVGLPVNVGPACKRTIASPPIQLPGVVLNVFPVITNMFVPSLATPEWPQIPPRSAAVAQPPTIEGLSACTPTTQP